VDSKRKVQAGNYLEMVGSYDPRVDKVELKADRIKHWVAEGAQPSDTVHNLLISNKIIEGKKRNVLPKKVLPKPEPVPTASEGAPAEAAPAAEPVETSAEEAPAPEAVAETTEEKAEATPADTTAEMKEEAAPAAEDSAVASEEPTQ
jgi:small subunit ribosomal protein S16